MLELRPCNTPSSQSHPLCVLNRNHFQEYVERVEDGAGGEREVGEGATGRGGGLPAADRRRRQNPAGAQSPGG